VKSIELFERSRKVAPGGVHSPVRAFKSVGGTPIFFKSAKGAYLESVEGNRYIDFCQSFGPNILGHRDEQVQAEVEQAVRDAWSFGACDPYSLDLAEWICCLVGYPERVRFVCSGTEAVMSALRVARAYTGRDLILKFEGCYHGHVDSMLVKAGSGLAGESSSDSAGVSAGQAKETLVAPLDDEAALERIFTRYGPQIAAVILEPLPANFGLLIQRREFLQAVVKLARHHGALVIFDEVISGFRVGLGGMAKELELVPDLVTFGKIIGGGVPIGAYAGGAKFMDMVAPSGPVYQAGTLAANPVGCRAGLATLKKLHFDKVHTILEERTRSFVDRLSSGFSSLGLDLKIVRQGSIFWIHKDVGQVIRRPDQFHPEQKSDFGRLFHACLERGIYFPPSAFEVGFVSYAHTAEILNLAAEKILEAAKSVYAR